METATAPGNQTSEFKVSAWTIALSALASIVGIIGGILDVLPQSKWVTFGLAAVGLVTAVLTALGYQVTRKAVKVAALNAAQENPTSTPNQAATNLGNLG